MSSIQTPIPQGLKALPTLELTGGNRQLLEAATKKAGGTPPWRTRKLAEARDLLALSQLAPRLHVAQLDLAESLRALLLLRTPVPCRPPQLGSLVIASHALLALTYREEALLQPQPGYAFLQVLAPPHVWHANVSADVQQALCLGPKLPAGIRVKELILMAYGALTMQTVQIDEQDPAGVLNAEAARWWQEQSAHRLPLSRTPFLSDQDLQPVGR